MPEQEVNPEHRMRLPIRLKADQPPSGEGPREKPKTTDDLFNEVMETLKKNMQLVAAARASREFILSPGMGRGEGGLCRRIPRR